MTEKAREAVTIYGGGYVGRAVERFLRGHYEVRVVDPKVPGSLAWLESTVEPSQLAVVCVPTPQLPDGRCDTSLVEGVVGNGRHVHYLVKSTVPPGTCARINQAGPTSPIVCFSPEYIGEGSYEVPWWQGYAHPTDISKHAFHIFGGPRFATRRWVKAWQRVAGWTPRYMQTDHTTAELAKYAENMFLATKKLFCSELFLAAEAFGVDYDELRELWLADVRVGPSMTLVWPERLAFGGKCLPKDTAALVAEMEARGFHAGLFRDVVERNRALAEIDAERAAGSDP